MRTEGKSDVLVVGAGPAGCSAGIVLARAGADVCVVDRARFPRDKTCGDAISNDAVGLIEQLGAGELVGRAPHALVRQAAAEFPDGSRVTRVYKRPGYIVQRRHLDDCLRKALDASGARLIQGHHVAALSRVGDSVTGAEGPELVWSAKVVIAAHGYGLLGLKALGQAPLRHRYLGLAATAYYRDIRFPHGADTADHFFDRELTYGYGWIFPAVDGVSNVGVYLRADAYARAGIRLVDLLADFRQRHAARFASAQPVGKVRTWSLPIGPRPLRVSAPGLLLAGDAGGFIDPLSGEGLWQALFTGARAGEIAAEALARGVLDQRLMRRYERACAREVGWPSRGKAWVQESMAFILKRDLYRVPWIRSALGWGYTHHLLEMTKS